MWHLTLLEVLLCRWKWIARITVDAIAVLIKTNVLSEDPVHRFRR